MSVKRHLGVLAVYGLLACLALYWNLFHLTTHVGGTWTTDYYHFHWNYWWIRHALTTGRDIYQTNYVLFPYTTNLGLHTLTPFWYPLWALLEPAIGTLPAMGIIMLVAMTLTGYTCFHLLRSEGVTTGLALVGGLILQLSPGVMLSVMLANINYLSEFWLPVHLLLWGAVATSLHHRRRALTLAVIQGIAFYAMLMTDLQHLLFLAFLLIPYGVLTLLRAVSWRDRVVLAGLGLLAVTLALALFAIFGPLRYMLAFDRTLLSPQPLESARGIPFPAGYAGRFATYDRIITVSALLIPAALFSLLAGVTFLRRSPDSRRWFWLALAIVPLLISAGPSVTIGETAIPMPFVLLYNLTGGLFRVPARFDSVFILALLVFIGRTWSPVLRRSHRLTTAVPVGLLLLTMLDSRLYQPMPLQPVTPPYAFYETMGREDYDYAIIEVPVAGGSGEAWVGEFRPMEAQFYGMTHGKKMLNGAIARAPLHYFWYWLYDDPMLAWLGQRRYLEPENVEAQLRDRIFNWPVGYIVIHQDWIGRAGPTNQEIIGYFNTLPDLLCPVFIEADAVAYRTAWHPDGCPPRTPPEFEPGIYLIDIGSPGDERFIGWGWHWPEDIFGLTLRWTGEYPQTQIYVDLPPGGYDLTLSAQSFWEDRQLTVLVNNQPLADSVTITPDTLHEFTFSVPAEAISDGQHLTVTLDYDDVIIPVEVGQSADPRRLAIAVDWLRFTRRESRP